MDVAGMNLNQSKSIYTEGNDPHCPCCPSCSTAPESCSHVLHCEEVGRVNALQRSIGWLDTCLEGVGTDQTLHQALVQYARGRGSCSVEVIVSGWRTGFQEFGYSQDKISWQRFMEGMISRETLAIQGDFVKMEACSLSLGVWVRGLVVKLLEVTHGQWLSCNVQVHNTASGIHATARKEEIQHWIEDQIELGEE